MVKPSLHYAPTRDGWLLALYHRAPARGGHATPVVLCHGMGSNRFNMDGPGRVSMARHLQRCGYDVWVLELRGAGRSHRRLRWPRVGYAWTFEDYVQHDVPAALALVRSLSGHERVLWVGHSLGGMVAYAASMTPVADLFAGVVTLASPGMTEIGHEAIDRWVALRRLLRLAPGRLPTRRVAQAGSAFAGPITSAFPTLIRDWLWHPDNLDLDVVRFMMRHGVEDLPRSLLIEFARWYEAKRMSDRYALFSFGDHLERIRVPMLVIAGGRDRLTPPTDLEHLVGRLGSADKTFWVAGHASGLSHEYSHVDLMLGRFAPDEVYPVVTRWLDERRPSSPTAAP
ncbi:alpha/beta fold hydrolase [Myxococcota bacterium]|nr:alpha/beta fold hydrolase [Myxococcota bacterium]MCZ7619220.1 lysophospholipase [Myxococcota bacterium]